MIEIKLIGPPAILIDGEPTEGPRGKKAWAVLGRLVRSDRPVSRRVLVDELFAEANDPMGALRSALAEIRRSTGLGDCFTGDPIGVALPERVSIDVMSLRERSRDGLLPDGTFLEGVEIASSEVFDTWLLVERQRVDAEVLSAARQAILQALSIRDHPRAIDLARGVVRRAPLDEGAHILLVKSLAASGQAERAQAQVEACQRLFLRELGFPPSDAVRAAARAGVADPVPGVSSRASAASLLDAGLAAVSAGAVDAGIECLRRAAADAETSGDAGLHALTLVELGTALVHAVRGYDDEGAVMLGAAREAAERAGQAGLAAKALMELGYVDIQAGRRTSAAGYLAEAERLAAGDPATLSGIVGFDALNLNDWGKREQAAERFEESLELSRSAGSRRREIWAAAVGAQTLIQVDRFDQARGWLESSIDLCDQERWTAFKPWPLAWMAKLRLWDGFDPVAVRADMEANLALSTQMGDPCWEGISAETIGLTYRAERNFASAIDWMVRGRAMCGRVSDSYMWFESQILRTAAETALEAGEAEQADAMARELIVRAARGQMDGLLADAMDLLARAGGPR